MLIEETKERYVMQGYGDFFDVEKSSYGKAI